MASMYGATACDEENGRVAQTPPSHLVSDEGERSGTSPARARAARALLVLGCAVGAVTGIVLTKRRITTRSTPADMLAYDAFAESPYDPNPNSSPPGPEPDPDTDPDSDAYADLYDDPDALLNANDDDADPTVVPDLDDDLTTTDTYTDLYDDPNGELDGGSATDDDADPAAVPDGDLDLLGAQARHVGRGHLPPIDAEARRETDARKLGVRLEHAAAQRLGRDRIHEPRRRPCPCPCPRPHLLEPLFVGRDVPVVWV